MKKMIFSAGLCALALSVAADPVKALLIVQNHADAEFRKPLSNIATRLSTALSGDVFEIIDPNDAVGVGQNRGVNGESMPLSAATRLAENLDARALITASIDDVSMESVGVPVRIQKLTVTMTLQAKRVPSGAGVKGVEVSVTSVPFQPQQFQNNAAGIYSKLISQLCRSAAELFLPEAQKISWTGEYERVMVAFGCNFPGADISIDGVSYGTAGTIGEAPLKLAVSPGLHNLSVTYPFAHPYAVTAKFVANSTYLINLEETAEGRRRQKEDAYFAELLDRARKSGATDDFVRSEKAKGYAQYLSSSHTRIEGMPQVLAKWNWNAKESPLAETGLNGAADEAGAIKPTESILKDAEKFTK